MKEFFFERIAAVENEYYSLLHRNNKAVLPGNGLFTKYKYPVLSAAHTPLNWRYDFDEERNPFFMERFGINAVFNAGAIKWQGKFIVMPRIEASDRKSFFAIAESSNGIDNFKFWDYPVFIPKRDDLETNIYDMRLVSHEDGFIYGLFCTERRDENASIEDQSAAIAQCGIVRTQDLIHWERLPDLKTNSSQQRNVVLHPQFVKGNYAFYTRPQSGFIEAGQGGGIALGFCKHIENAVIENEVVIDSKKYHTIYESKNGLGPAPIKTTSGWLHLAHGVRNTAAGLRYVLYLFMTDLEDISKIIYKPAGYFMAPEGEERIGDVSNVLFSNGWIVDDDERVFIYYASSDTRLHVAVSSVNQLVDYVMNTPKDGLTSFHTVSTLMTLIEKNESVVVNK